MVGDRIRTTLVIGLLTAAAVWLNLNAPTVFFDTQLMVGGSLGVFALLQFGWPGLVVGVAALAVTFVRWGHPFELIVGTGFLVWLGLFLSRFNGGLANRGNGRVLLAAVAYWLLLGFWLEVAFLGIAFGMNAVAAVGLGLKETVTSLINATLGFLFFTALKAAQGWRQTGGMRPRELSVGIVLVAVTLPAMILIFVLSSQVRNATLQARLAEMRATGTRAAVFALDDPAHATVPSRGDGGGRQFAIRRAGGIIATSAPQLFARLARDYVEELPSRTGNSDLRIYRPRTDAAVIAADAESYLATDLVLPSTVADDGDLLVTVVEPLRPLAYLLDYQLILPSFSVILGFLVVGAIASSLVNAASDSRERAEQIKDEAEHSLQAATERMRLAAAAAGIGFWSRDLASKTEEWDDEMLRIYGVSRAEFDGRWEPFVHPDDLHRVLEETHRAIRDGSCGEYTYRIIRPDGTIRQLKGLSHALRDTNGHPTHELGVNFDITRQVESDAALAAAREQELRQEESHRRDLEKKLKTSLNAAAIAHEINQPLSRIILRARMGLETAVGADREMLAALTTDAERVVSVIEKMKVLLRNVETVQQKVDLAAVIASAIHQVKRPLHEAGVTVIGQGLDRGCMVLGDDVQLQLVVINLLTNAIEAIVAGDGPRREIVVELNAHDDVVDLVVGDSGPGWPGGTIDEMLLNTTKAGGAGVGLYVVKTAVENHKGRITIGRSPLGGAEFRVRFPGMSATPSPLIPGDAPEPAASLAASGQAPVL